MKSIISARRMLSRCYYDVSIKEYRLKKIEQLAAEHM